MEDREVATTQGYTYILLLQMQFTYFCVDRDFLKSVVICPMVIHLSLNNRHPHNILKMQKSFT